MPRWKGRWNDAETCSRRSSPRDEPRGRRGQSERRKVRSSSLLPLPQINEPRQLRFMQDQGADPTLLSAAGYGQYHPIAPNDSPENRSQNRRIEIVLAPAG